MSFNLTQPDMLSAASSISKEMVLLGTINSGLLSTKRPKSLFTLKPKTGF